MMGPRWLIRALPALLALVLLATAAEAAPPANSAAKEKAKALVAEAEVNYKLGRFEEALDRYSQAYEIFPAPALLFNIGQCHKHLKNHERAIFFFEGYLRDKSNTQNRALVEGLIAESKKELEKEQQLAEEQRRRDMEREAAERQARAAAEEQERSRREREALQLKVRPGEPTIGIAGGAEAGEPTHRPVYKRWWFWTAIAVVAAGAAAGAVYVLAPETVTVPPSGSLGTVDRR